MAGCRPRLAGGPGSACRALVCCLPFSPGSLSPGANSQHLLAPHGVSTPEAAPSRLAGWLVASARTAQLWAPLWLCLQLTGVPCPRHPVPASPLTREARPYLPPSAWESQLSLQAQHLQVCSHPAPPARSRPLSSVLRSVSLVPTGSRAAVTVVCLAPVPSGSPCIVKLHRSPPLPATPCVSIC